MLINPSDLYPVLVKEEEEDTETTMTIRTKEIPHTYTTPRMHVLHDSWIDSSILWVHMTMAEVKEHAAN